MPTFRASASVLAAALSAALAAATPAPAAREAPLHLAAAAVTTHVTVTAGQPSEFRFKLSKSAVAPGTVVFHIVNRGHLSHDFKIEGKKTKLLAPGKSINLRVVFKKSGQYSYFCTVPGHAAAGMKGILRVKMPAAAAAAAIVNVKAGKPSELAFNLSKTSKIPAGPITFKVTNLGVAFHNFKICTVPLTAAGATKNACAGKATKILKPGQSATLKVMLNKTGMYEFLCSVTGHAAAGMKGIIGIGVAVTTAEQNAASVAEDPNNSSSTGGTPPSTTTPTATTPTPGAGGGSGGEVGAAVGCPPGVTVRASGNTDGDGDELGTERDDQDGCV